MVLIIYSVLIAFFISLLLGPIFIPILHKLKFGQIEREEGPRSHKAKAGTPTIGGVIFIISTVITLLVIVRNPRDEAMIALYTFVLYGIIGLIDDLLKIRHKNNLGLRAYQKMLLILIVAAIVAFYGKSNMGTSIIFPFIKKNWDLGIFYIPFIIFFFAATTNAVNLTDGLDGLATSITILVMTFLAIVSFLTGHISLAIFSGALAGALLGFLRYNSYPAQVIMGDTGSIALGGAVAAITMLLKLPLIVIIVGGIYVLEAVSVILQVVSFKTTHKRIFKMAPIHHHFELSGWHETKVVAVFSIATVILCLIGFLSLQ